MQPYLGIPHSQQSKLFMQPIIFIFRMLPIFIFGFYCSVSVTLGTFKVLCALGYSSAANLLLSVHVYRGCIHALPISLCVLRGFPCGAEV